MALKPISQSILIVVAVSAMVYVASKYYSDHSAPDALPVSNAPMAPAPTPVSVQAAGDIGTSYQTIVEKGVVRVGVQSPSKPFFYTEKGVAKGFNVDFMKLLFAQSEFTQKHKQIVIDTDYTVDTYPAVPETLLKKDTRGNTVVDIAIDGLTFADSDLKGVVYSVPYVEDFGYSLIAPSGKDIRSLEGMTIGILEGDPDVEAYVKRYMIGAKFVALSDASVNGQRTWINDAIKAGKVDAVVYDYPFAVAEIAGTDLQFALTKLPESDIKYKIAVRREDLELLGSINFAIRKAKQDPQYAELIQKYFQSTKVAAVSAAAGGETTYVVKRGDTLGGIAAALLGDKNRYVAIQARNNLANPNLIQVGQALVIPK
jgi:ABC-type amino acid transport substrate-binding protein